MYGHSKKSFQKRRTVVYMPLVHVHTQFLSLQCLMLAMIQRAIVMEEKQFF